MAHEIEGNYSFFASGKPAWHGLGTVLKDAPSIDEAWKLAYPHEIFKLPLSVSIEGSDGIMYTAIKNHCGIIRDDGAELGVVGADYEVVQPYEAFSFFEPFIESGLVELEAGGSLCDGKRMWALAKIKDAEADIIGNDPVKGYFLVHTSFDGSLAHGIQFTGVRVVCANTLAMAVGAAKGMFSNSHVRFKHTKNIKERIENVKTQVDVANRTFGDNVKMYRTLAKKKMSRKEQEAYITKLFVPNIEEIIAEGKYQEKVSAKMENKINHVIDLLDSQKGLQLVPAIKGTAWQAYNAVSQYVTHDYGHSDDTRLNAQWFGASKNLNQKALEMAMA